MQLHNVEAWDLPSIWFALLELAIDHGREYKIDKGSYEGQKRLELDYVTLHVTHPGTRPLIPDVPPGLGVTAPCTQEYLDEYVEYVMTDTKPKKNETYTYGQRICGLTLLVDETSRLDEVDQVYAPSQYDQIIEKYKQGHNNNQCTIEVAKPDDINLSDPPCLRIIDTRISNNQLHFIIYFRSWDLWGGLPANLAALQLLKESMASEIGVEDGEIIASSKGLHLYDYAWDFARRRTMK